MALLLASASALLSFLAKALFDSISFLFSSFNTFKPLYIEPSLRFFSNITITRLQESVNNRYILPIFNLHRSSFSKGFI